MVASKQEPDVEESDTDIYFNQVHLNLSQYIYYTSAHISVGTLWSFVYSLIIPSQQSMQTELEDVEPVVTAYWN